jgi:hypothetical protein
MFDAHWSDRRLTLSVSSQGMPLLRRLGLMVALAAGFCFLGAFRGMAQDAAPAPTAADTADILALLDQEKPDPAKTAKLSADADVAIPANLSAPKRAEAYFHRAQARVLAGRVNDGIADGREAVRLSKGENYERVTSRYMQSCTGACSKSGT